MGLGGVPGTSSLFQVILKLVGPRETLSSTAWREEVVAHFKLGLTSWWEDSMQGCLREKGVREAWGEAVMMVLTEVERKSLERKGQSRSPDRSHMALGQRGQKKAISMTPLP